MRNLKTLIYILTAILIAGCEKDTISKSESNEINITEDPSDYLWDSSSAIAINFDGTTIATTSSKVTVNGNKATIKAAGDYIITGTLSDGQLLINTTDKGTVKLILNGISMTSSNSAPIFIVDAEKTVIILADNTVNTITDASKYIFSSGEDEPNAAVFSKSDLIIYGYGELFVNGNYNDGISSKDGLIIKDTKIVTETVDDGIRGKDYLLIHNSSIKISTKGDGLKSDNESNSSAGFINIKSSEIIISSGGDGISAINKVDFEDGNLNIIAGGGSGNTVSSSSSAKGIKAGKSITISCETLQINTAEDALHSDGYICINSGEISISASDDGMHAENTIEINDGNININNSYEGIEAAIITINGGSIHIESSDDGINGVGGATISTQYGNVSSGNMFINGGYIVVTSAGDGIDINGSINMSSGTVIIHGPTNSGNSAIDYDGEFKITGGSLIAAGSSGMAQAPGTSSTQNSLLLNLSSVQQAGTLLCIQKNDGATVACFKPTKNYQSIAMSSALLESGSTYHVYLGGSSTGTLIDGVYEGGCYTWGTKYTSFSITGVVTKIGNTERP